MTRPTYEQLEALCRGRLRRNPFGGPRELSPTRADEPGQEERERTKMTTMTTTQDRARELRESFEARIAHDGSTFWTLKDGSPAWMTDAVRAAHGGMLPDDQRYAFVVDAAEAIAEMAEGDDTSDRAHEFADDVDVYTSDLLAWVASHLDRVGYCDEAQDSGLVGPETDFACRLMAGQYVERRETFELLFEALDGMEDDQ